MFKNVICLLAIGSLVMTVSCNKKSEDKKEVHILTDHEATVAGEPTKKTIPADGKYPMMSFENNEHDFGSIEKDSKVEYSFVFKNTGEADLVIEKAMGSCGCTIPEYPKTPIKPGESEKIKVSFNSKGKSGNQEKSVTIITNTEEGIEKLMIKASIKE
ncbi:MAG: DUF1573 domain-containing protein [Bacteroidota bacterium]